MDMKSVNDIRNDIQQLAYNEYLRGFEAVLSVLNDSYVKHVWHKEDSEKLQIEEIIPYYRNLDTLLSSSSKSNISRFS